MKWVGRLVLSLLLALSISPSVGFAFSDKELGSFLSKEGITEEQLSEHLSRFWGSTIDEFETIKELDEFLGEKITPENLQETLEVYEIASKEELVALLVENEEMEATDTLENVFIYVDALDMTVDFYSGTEINEETLQQLVDDYGITLEELHAIFEKNDDSVDEYDFIEDLEDMLYVYGLPLNDQTLQNLLDDYGLTLEELNSILAANGDSLDQFDSIDDLEYALLEYGLPVTEQNLQELLDTFEMTRAELDALLAKYDDSVSNYETIDELYFTVILITILEEDSDELLADLGIGLDKQELVNLAKHFMTLDILDEAFMDKLTELEERLAAFGDFESANDLTTEEMSELIAIYREIMNLFELDAKYYLVKGNEKIALSEQEALTLENANGYDLLIELYNLEGVFLADIVLTNDLFGSDLIDKVEDKLEVVKTVPKEAASTESDVVKTVKGGKLPNTAGNYAEGLLAGLAMIIIGAIWFRKRTVKHS
ncbi:processed acidic surface protein [Mesobacillus maritimus]|uniref:processed acidic surface protein n=1 Tax=Mesobacillus maritimus TaxID=1643336 RepID=UPI00203D3E89|nr:processed acidic surface protein [Mesobacillus maritimus]MCM3585208.1 processed acidic surface protein [Mesobacillus maritimus]